MTRNFKQTFFNVHTLCHQVTTIHIKTSWSAVLLIRGSFSSCLGQCCTPRGIENVPSWWDWWSFPEVSWWWWCRQSLPELAAATAGPHALAASLDGVADGPPLPKDLRHDKDDNINAKSIKEDLKLVIQRQAGARRAGWAG
jgi:hypothetical protein